MKTKTDFYSFFTIFHDVAPSIQIIKSLSENDSSLQNYFFLILGVTPEIFTPISSMLKMAIISKNFTRPSMLVKKKLDFHFYAYYCSRCDPSNET